MATETTTSIQLLVGHDDGQVLEDGSVVVYDYDEDKQFIGWHKSPQGGK